MRGGRSDFLAFYPSRTLAQKHAFLPLFEADVEQSEILQGRTKK